MRRTVIALLLLVSGAATAVAQPAKQNPPASQKGHCDIGVVSDLGEKFYVDNGNLMDAYLGRNVSVVGVESWHLDDLVVDRIRGALGKRAVVQRIPYRKEAFPTFHDRPNLIGLFGFGATEFREGLRLAPGTRCARYVLVTEGWFREGNSGPAVVGLGIMKTILAGFQIHTVINVWIVDGEIFKPLYHQMAHTAKSRTPFPVRGVAESFWPDPPNSAAQNAKLREAVRELIAQGLDATLPELRLTP